MAGSGKAVPSSDIRDLEPNANTLDELVSSSALTTTARVTPTNPSGKTIRTLAGIQAEAQEILNNLGLEYPPIAYTAGLTVERSTQTYTFNDVVYINTRTDKPFTATGAFDEGGWQIVQQINQSTVIFTSDGIKGLEDVALIDRAVYSVSGFYAGTEVGGGQFIYDSSIPKSEHLSPASDFVCFAPEAILAWNGTEADIATLLNYSGSTSELGVFVLQVKDYLRFSQLGGSVDNADNYAQLMKAFGLCRQLKFGETGGKFHGTPLLLDQVGDYVISQKPVFDFSITIRGLSSLVTLVGQTEDTRLLFPSSSGIELTEGHFRFRDFTIEGVKAGGVNVATDTFGNVGMRFFNVRAEMENVEVYGFDTNVLYKEVDDGTFAGAYRNWSNSRIRSGTYNFIADGWNTDCRFINTHIDAPNSDDGYILIRNNSTSGYVTVNFVGCLLESLGNTPAGFDIENTAGIQLKGTNVKLFLTGCYEEATSIHGEKDTSIVRSGFIKNTAARIFSQGHVNVKGSYSFCGEMDFPPIADALWSKDNITYNGVTEITDGDGPLWVDSFTLTGAANPQLNINDFIELKNIYKKSAQTLSGKSDIALMCEVEYTAPAGANIKMLANAFPLGFSASGRYDNTELDSIAGRKRFTSVINISVDNIQFLNPKVTFTGASGDTIGIGYIKWSILG